MIFLRQLKNLIGRIIMWPFSCKSCEIWQSNCQGFTEQNVQLRNHYLEMVNKVSELRKLSELEWLPLANLPPIKTNLLVANKDFTYFGFLYLEDGWDYSKKINMQGKEKIWATYTNTESIAWWLNLDLIKKDNNVVESN